MPKKSKKQATEQLEVEITGKDLQVEVTSEDEEKAEIASLKKQLRGKDLALGNAQKKLAAQSNGTAPMPKKATAKPAAPKKAASKPATKPHTTLDSMTATEIKALSPKRLVSLANKEIAKSEKAKPAPKKAASKPAAKPAPKKAASKPSTPKPAKKHSFWEKPIKQALQENERLKAELRKYKTAHKKKGCK